MAETPDPLLRLIVPAVPEAVADVRHRVRAHLQAFGIQAAGAVELAVAEAVGNAALHAYVGDPSGEVEVAVNVGENKVEVVVHDDGIGPSPNPQHRGGRYGVVLMEALSDSFELDGAPGTGTTVRMEFGVVR